MKLRNGFTKAQEQNEQTSYQSNQDVSTLFDRFIKEKRYLNNLSEKTLRSYQRDVFKRWMKYMGGLPTPQNITQFVIKMREDGLSPTTCNISIRSFNSFLSWLQTQGFPYMHLPQLKEEKKIMRTPPDTVLSKIANYRPQDTVGFRTHAIACTLIDCGFRINEVLTLKYSNVDFDNLLIKVTGKGSKDRVVPMSIELRKVLYRYLRYRKTRFESPYFFCTNNGTKLSYHNLYRDLKSLLDDIGIPKDFDGLFHMFRRKYARNYLKHGGNLIYLQTTMGHSTITMTRKYVEVETEDLQQAHLKTSLLARLR